MTHPVIKPFAVAVITGGASGIGLAAAKRFIEMGLNVCIADLPGDALDSATSQLIALSSRADEAVLSIATDVSKRKEIEHLVSEVKKHFGKIDILMNNAGIQPGSDILDSNDQWHNIINVNFWGVVNSTQIFLPIMQAQGMPGIIINTGSKQGITTPPGDPAYNISKTALKTFTEALEHTLRNSDGPRISAHLLIPGFVYTPLTAGDRTEKPYAAWTPEQTIDFMMEKLAAGDFYILCPDNDVTRELDEKRIFWAAHDIIDNRPPLSRWHTDYTESFNAFISK